MLRRMDSNILAAIITSVASAGSTAGVAITALVLSNKGIDRVEKKLDDLDKKLDDLDKSMKDGLEGVGTKIDMLTESFHEIDKRLSILEDRKTR